MQDLSPKLAEPTITKADWRPRSPRLYLAASIFSVIVAGFYCIPLTPVFIKMFVNFPALEEAKKMTGTIEVVGQHSYSARWPAAYYIVTETGRYQLYCGLPTKRISCFGSDKWVQGATGTVWFHETFGLLQWELLWQQPEVRGRTDAMPYLVEKNHFEYKFNFGFFQGKFFTVLAALGVALYQFMRYRTLKAEQINPQTGEGH